MALDQSDIDELRSMIREWGSIAKEPGVRLQYVQQLVEFGKVSLEIPIRDLERWLTDKDRELTANQLQAVRHGFLACAGCVRGKTWEQLDAQRVLMRRKKSRGAKRRERVKKLAEKHGVIDRYGDAIE